VSVTMAGLARHKPFGLVQLADTTEAPEVEWVHVSELSDPTPFPSEGTLLLTTGLGLPEGTDKATVVEYVRRIAQSGAAGLGFGIGRTHACVPAELIEQCRQAGLPLMEVPLDTRFVDIARWVADDALRTAVRASKSASEVERKLVRSLLSADPQSALVRTLASGIRGWAMLLDRDGHALVIEPSAASRELPIVQMERTRLLASGATTAPWSRQGSSAALHCIEVDAETHAYLAVGADTALGEQQCVVAAALNLLSFEAGRQAAVRRSGRLLRSAIVQLLLGGLHVHAALAASRAGIDLPEGSVRVAVLLPRDQHRGLAALLDHAERDFTLTLINAIFAEEDRGGRLLAVLTAADGDLEALAQVMMISGGGHAAVSEPVSIEELPQALLEANTLASTIGSASPPVVTRSHVRGTGLLAYLDTPSVLGFVDALLAPLREASPTTSIDLMETLRVFLATDGNWAEASARLEIHRHTLRYRIHKIEGLLGRRMDDTSTRAELWVALQIFADR
jgi:purine catabolism regulator